MGGALDRLVTALAAAFAARGVALGAHVRQDSTPVPARGRDPEATYNDHYEIIGYNVDLLVDRELGVPIARRTITATEPDGDGLIPLWERAEALGVRLRTARIDGAYASFRDLAHAAARGVNVVCTITRTWVHHPEATQRDLEARHATHWREDGYVPRPPSRRLIEFLVERGDGDLVGARYRNGILAHYEEAPTEYLDAHHERNRSESTNAHIKNDLDLVTGWRGKGKASLDLHASQRTAALLAVALTRAQHGVTTDLIGLRGLV